MGQPCAVWSHSCCVVYGVRAPTEHQGISRVAMSGLRATRCCVSVCTAAGPLRSAGSASVLGGRFTRGLPNAFSGHEAELEWTQVDGAASNWIFASQNGGAYAQLPYPVNEPKLTVGWLFPPESYSFCIEASNGTLRSPRSNCRAATYADASAAAPATADSASLRDRSTATPAAPVALPPDPGLLQLIQTQRLGGQ
jgi:hypothetical protein